MAALSLTDAERLALAELGVSERGGVLRAADGDAVDPGTAALLLKLTRHPATGRFVADAAPGIPASHPAEPGDFRRGWIEDGHQAQPPGTLPPSNRHPGGSLAADVFTDAAAAAAGNARQSAADRLSPYRLPAHAPAPSRTVMSPDMGATSVPKPADMTMRAPGERDD